MKKKILFICTAALFVLAALNLKLAFNNGLNINFSLASMEALARGETLYCSVCGEQVDACRCSPAITCDYGHCLGKECHEFTGNLICSCRANGDPFSICPL
jgi:hypothetical protein